MLENHQTQPTCDRRPGNQTCATLQEGECSHHCINPAPKASKAQAYMFECLNQKQWATMFWGMASTKCRNGQPSRQSKRLRYFWYAVMFSVCEWERGVEKKTHPTPTRAWSSWCCGLPSLILFWEHLWILLVTLKDYELRHKAVWQKSPTKCCKTHLNIST